MIINVYTLILRIFTDLHTCLQGSESIVLAGNDTIDACFKDRKSRQRIGHIFAHTQIFRRAGCLIVACEGV
jgi:ABC-type polar amino acid transport system ATPase subunit